MTKTFTPLRLAALSSAALVFFAAAPAVAQDGQGRGHTVTIGLGPQFNPKFPGADSYGINPYPVVGLRREGTPMPFESSDEGFGFGLLGGDSPINFGPVVNFQGERQEDDVGAPVGDVGFTIEAGGFVNILPTRNIRLRGELRQGIGGHEALTGDVMLDFIVRDDETYIFSIGPRARWGDSDYHHAYFGVSTANPAFSLPAYNPGGGFYAVGASAGLTYKVGRNWGFQGYAAYDRLIGDAADSPIVQGYGSRDQFSGGLGLFFEFNIGG